MRWFAPLVAATLVYAMTPGMAEAAENIAHLITHGDTAHGDGHEGGADDRRDGSDEHGCSGPFHACACHNSGLFLVATVDVQPTPEAGLDGDSRPMGGARDSGVVRGVDRPPRR